MEKVYVLECSFEDERDCNKCMLSVYEYRTGKKKCAALGYRPLCPKTGFRYDCPLQEKRIEPSK